MLVFLNILEYPLAVLHLSFINSQYLLAITAGTLCIILLSILIFKRAFSLKYSKKIKILVLYGSESGNAEEFAHDFAATLQGEFQNCTTVLKCCNQLKRLRYQLAQYNIILIITSTYGEGEPPSNAESFQLLLEQCKVPFFSNCRFAVFGLGDSSYVHFNAFGIYCHEKFVALGAKPFLDITLGDDSQDDVKKDYVAWKKLILEKLSIESRGCHWEEGKVHCKFSIASHHPNPKRPTLSSSHLGDADFPLNCQLVHLENMESSCLYNEIHLFIPSFNTSLLPGDHLIVLPKNSSHHVQLLLEYLNVDLFEKFSLIDNSASKIRFNGTLSEFVTSTIDLNRPISEESIRYLLEIVTNKQDRDYLTNLSASYSKLVHDEYKNIVEVLLRLKTTLQLKDFVNCVEFIHPRYYSIITADYDSIKKGLICKLVFKNIIFSSPTGISRNGLATGHFSSFPESLNVYFAKSNFHMIKFTNTPIILIGNGTGIAPYVGFLHQRAKKLGISPFQDKDKKSVEKEGKAVKNAEAILLYGCYNEECFLYQDHFQYYLQTGVLSHVFVAYSRSSACKKQHVQDKLMENASFLFELVHKKHAVIYVCGDSHGMGKSVRDCWKNIFKIYGKMNDVEATNYLQLLCKDIRYREDIY